MSLGAERAHPSAPLGAYHTNPPPAPRGRGRGGAGRGVTFSEESTGDPSPLPFSASAPFPQPKVVREGESLLYHAAETLEGKLPFTDKIKFTNNKVVRVAFVIFLICAVTIGVAALIVHYPVVSSAFFTILSLTGGVSLIAIAFQGLNGCRKNRKNPTPGELS